MPRVEMTRVVVRHYPDRKKPCLVIEQGNQGMVLATFQNEKCVEIYKCFLQGDCMQREMSWLFDAEGNEKRTYANCLLDGTDACSRGAGRAVDDSVCEDFI